MTIGLFFHLKKIKSFQKRFKIVNCDFSDNPKFIQQQKSTLKEKMKEKSQRHFYCSFYFKSGKRDLEFSRGEFEKNQAKTVFFSLAKQNCFFLGVMNVVSTLI